MILLAALVMLMIKVPDKEKWHYLKITRVFLFCTYALLALAGIASLLFEFQFGPVADRRSAILTMAFWQAFLFTCTAIAYIQPLDLTWRRVSAGIVGILPLMALAWLDEILGPGVQTVAAVAYLAFMGGCTWLFRREFRKGLKQLEEHYDEDFGVRMRWVPNIFYGALTIGVLALIFSVFNMGILFYDLFVITHTCFYLYVINRMRFYLHNGDFLVDVVASRPHKKKKVNQLPPVESAGMTVKENNVNEAIRQWVEQEKFLLTDVSIDQVADELHMTHDDLNAWCSEHYGLLFRSWRMQLRIEKAKQLLQANREIKISDLQQQTGFSDKSYFFKQFKQLTGMTPTEFRRSIEKLSR